MSEPLIQFRTTATMETDLEYFFEVTQSQVDAIEKEYGSLARYIRNTVDGGDFIEIECSGDWRWGEVHPVEEDERRWKRRTYE